MSHIASVEVEVKDLSCLAQAARSLGLELVQGQKTYKWYGKSLGGDPLPEGFETVDLGKCEHAIRIPDNPNAYEIGVVRRRDGRPGYVLHWDFWCGGFGLKERVGDGCALLVQAYATQVAIKQARAQGYSVHETMDVEGNIRLTMTR